MRWCNIRNKVFKVSGLSYKVSYEIRFMRYSHIVENKDVIAGEKGYNCEK